MPKSYGLAVRAYRLAVPVSDVRRSIEFYEAVLGLEADETVPTRVYFHCGGFIVALVQGEGSVPHLPDNLYVSTDELDAVYDRAVTAGAEVTSGIEVRPWNERSFYCLDPDRNPLCFVDDQTLFLGGGAAWS